jgi:hypothetical protein
LGIKVAIEARAEHFLPRAPSFSQSFIPIAIMVNIAPRIGSFKYPDRIVLRLAANELFQSQAKRGMVMTRH